MSKRAYKTTTKYTYDKEGRISKIVEKFEESTVEDKASDSKSPCRCYQKADLPDGFKTATAQPVSDGESHLPPGEYTLPREYCPPTGHGSITGAGKRAPTRASSSINSDYISTTGKPALKNPSYCTNSLTANKPS